jgi:hypothetical protein
MLIINGAIGLISLFAKSAILIDFGFLQHFLGTIAGYNAREQDNKKGYN